MSALSVSPTAFRRPGMLDNAHRSSVTVQRGDTMTGIAQRLNVPFDKLRNANPQIVDPNWIYPGDVLNVPECTSVTVQYGDTMIGIAKRLNVPFEKLRNANPQIVDPNWIYPGDVLNVPECASVTVQYGDTMIGIAQRLNVPFEKLRDANPQIADPNWIYPGDVLNVPECAPTAIEVTDNLLTGHHSNGNFFEERVSFAGKQGKILHAPDANHPSGKKALDQEAKESSSTLTASAGGWERKSGASRITEHRNGQWQTPKIERHDGEKIANKPEAAWEKKLYENESHESQETLIDLKYLNAKYEKWHEATEVKARASVNSDGLSFGAVASSHRAAHKIAASGGVDGLRAGLEAEAGSYYGEINIISEVSRERVKAEANFGVGAHVVKGKTTLNLEIFRMFGMKGDISCEIGAGLGIEAYLGVSVEASNRKVKASSSIALGLIETLHAKCSIELGYDD